jgi:hypothetical protein
MVLQLRGRHRAAARRRERVAQRRDRVRVERPRRRRALLLEVAHRPPALVRQARDEQAEGAAT